MRVTFKTTRLAAAAVSERQAVAEFGRVVGRKYLQRVAILHAARDVAALTSLAALRFHALHGDRHGENALDLTGQMRLIITFQDERMTVVRVEEVSKHYD